MQFPSNKNEGCARWQGWEVGISRQIATGITSTYWESCSGKTALTWTFQVIPSWALSPNLSKPISGHSLQGCSVQDSSDTTTCHRLLPTPYYPHLGHRLALPSPVFSLIKLLIYKHWHTFLIERCGTCN